MDRNFPAHKGEAMAQVHSRWITSNVRRSQASNSFTEILTQSTEGNQVSTLKDLNKKNDAPLDSHHFNIPNELLDSMEEQRLENCFSMLEHDLTMYEDETTVLVYHC